MIKTLVDTLPGCSELNLLPVGLTVETAKRCLLAVDSVLGITTGIEIQKVGERGGFPFESSLLNTLTTEWGKASKSTVDRSVSGLLSRGGGLTTNDIDNIMDIADAELSLGFTSKARPNLFSVMDKSYKRGKKSSMKKVKATFNYADIERIDWLQEHHLYWVGTYYDDKVSGALAKDMVEGVKAGLGRESMGKRVKEFFKKYPGVPSKPDSYWTGLAANGMNRSRNFGLISGYETVGVKALEVLAVMDERTSDICRDMNGRIIPITTAVGQRDWMMAAESPEDIKTIAPWPKLKQIQGKSTAEVNAQGVIMPPYHFYCRTTVVEKTMR